MLIKFWICIKAVWLMSKPGVIVLGGHVQSLGICRLLGGMSISAILIDDTRSNLARHSKCCSKFFFCQQRDLVQILQSSQFQNEYKGWLVLPTNDHHVKLLGENKSQLEAHYIVGCSDWDKIIHFYEKSLSYPLAAKLGIPVPRTVVVEGIVSTRNILGDFTFPVIIKPSVMQDFYELYHKKVIKCDTPEQVIICLSRMPTAFLNGNLLIQEIIPGDSSNLYSVGMNITRDRVIDSITARRARQHPLDFGNSTTFAETVELPILGDYAKRILSAVGYEGLAEVEFKYDQRDRKFKFLEVNPRTWKWHTLTYMAGIPLLENYVRMRFGLDTLLSQQQSAQWKHSLLDIPVRWGLRLKKLDISDQGYPEIRAVWSWSDPLPGLFELLYLPLNIIKRR